MAEPLGKEEPSLVKVRGELIEYFEGAGRKIWELSVVSGGFAFLAGVVNTVVLLSPLYTGDRVLVVDLWGSGNLAFTAFFVLVAFIWSLVALKHWTFSKRFLQSIRELRQREALLARQLGLEQE